MPTVWVLEPEPNLRVLLNELFADEGFDVRFWSAPAEVARAAARGETAVLIADIDQLSYHRVASYPTVTEQVAALSRVLPVLALTSTRQTEDWLVDGGSSYVLSDGFADLEVLLDVVRGLAYLLPEGIPQLRGTF